MTGKWFDGSKRQIVEEVIWLSPDFLSRWLGYLSVKEDWNETEIETRWIKLKARLMNEMAFVVRVSALERADPYELGLNTEPDSKSISKLKYRFFYSPDRTRQATEIAPSAQSEKEIRSRKPEMIAALPTFISTDWTEPLLSAEAFKLSTELGYAMGKSITRYTVFTMPIPHDLRNSLSFQFKVFSASRTREARFTLIGRERV